MTSTITTDGKNFLALNAGSGSPNYCYVITGLTYYDADGISHTGGTVDVASSFLGAHFLSKDSAVIIAGMTYIDWKNANDGIDIVLDDITWVYNNPTYCYTITSTTTTVSPTTTTVSPTTTTVSPTTTTVSPTTTTVSPTTTTVSPTTTTVSPTTTTVSPTTTTVSPTTTTIIQAGFGGIEMIAIVGLAIGTLYMMFRKPPIPK
jgi:hypothetical protein